MTSAKYMYFFFFQAEDGIRDIGVTGVQTCALPISSDACPRMTEAVVRRLTPRNPPGPPRATDPEAADVTAAPPAGPFHVPLADRKSTRLNSSHANISYAVFCLKKKKNNAKPPMQHK